MSPAIDAATATTVPTVSAAALPKSSVQPSRAKSIEVPKSATIVIPDVGLEVTPTMPTMRDDTVTKRNAKAAMQTAPIPLIQNGPPSPMACGRIAMSAMTMAAAPKTKDIGRSRSVRSFPSAGTPRRMISFTPILSEFHIVGIDLMTVRIPANATAPAPMYRM